MENKKPLSPHIQVYKWHISSLVSISHRITGIINIIGITLICLWASLLLLGENSYGKGSVQSIIPLKNDGAIRLTVAKYYLPSGKSISEVGVSPDIEIDEENDDFRIKTETDNQLEYAIKLLKG